MIHISGPITVPPNAPAADDPYGLGEGQPYYVVHAEMVMSHRWVAA